MKLTEFFKVGAVEGVCLALPCAPVLCASLMLCASLLLCAALRCSVSAALRSLDLRCAESQLQMVVP